MVRAYPDIHQLHRVELLQAVLSIADAAHFVSRPLLLGMDELSLIPEFEYPQTPDGLLEEMMNDPPLYFGNGRSSTDRLLLVFRSDAIAYCRILDDERPSSARLCDMLDEHMPSQRFSITIWALLPGNVTAALTYHSYASNGIQVLFRP